MIDKTTLDQNFSEPPAWRWHHFTRNNRRLRFGSSFPQDSIPDAVVVCLPGLSEFAEKYFELARECNENNLAFYIIDWMGQGQSDRYLSNTHKRHGQNFDEDIADLHYFIVEYIKHSSVHPDKGRIPMAMLGHSLGGHLGLRYLSQHKDTFECAAFSAPFLNIHRLGHAPLPLLISLSTVLNLCVSKFYAVGQGNWRADLRMSIQDNKFSSDPMRNAIHNHWCMTNPNLQVGGVTYGWVHEALKSCAKLKRSLHTIETPCMLAVAENDRIVDNNAIFSAAKKIRLCDVIKLPDAKHEILMEQDYIRKIFINQFYALIRETIIDKPETIRPF